MVIQASNNQALISPAPTNDNNDTFSSEEGKNTVTLTKSEDGKTLTISGKGDLTKLDKTYSFVSNLASNTVFTGSENTYTSVNASASYDASNNYYTRSASYSAIDNFKETYVESKTSQKYVFTSSAVNVYFTNDGYNEESAKDKWVSVKEGDEVDCNNQRWQFDGSSTGTKYWTRSEKDGQYEYTRVADYNTITSNTTNCEQKEVTTEVLKNVSGVFTTDGSKYTESKAGEAYDATKTYYLRTWNYTSATLDDLYNQGYLKYESAFLTALWKIGESKTVETVKFENTGSDALLIDNEIVKAILYYQQTSETTVWYVSNSTLKTLDLGATTVKNLSQTTFLNDLGARDNLAITSITLPLAEKNGDEMTVPSQVLSQFGGNPSTLTTVTIPEGYTALADHAFGGDGSTTKILTELSSVTLPSTLMSIGDNAFQACAKITGITLNDNLKTIGKYAFWGTGLTSINFPEQLDKIGDAAFADCNIQELNFNDKLRYIGAGAFALPSAMTLTTIEIPASVRYIGPGAFNFRQYQDVYFYGSEAPLMPMGSYTVGTYTTNDVTAFNAHTQMGNNGFIGNAVEGTLCEDTSKGYANRENYHGNSAYFCILHFPSGLTTDQANKYQDQTRVYQTQTTDFSSNATYTVGQEADNFRWTIYGSVSQPTKDVNYGYQDTYLGAQYVWPSQSQWGRAYVVASNGYNWNGVDQYFTNLSNDDYAVLKEAGYFEGEVSELSDEVKKNLQKIAHLGTRMFVLANADAKSDPDYPIDIKSGGHWWTLVVPFNMTKKQVDAVFGDGTNPTHVCRFNKVDRITEEGNTYVKLYFTDDVYAHKAVKTGDNYAATTTDAVGDDDVVIYAHEAYMIYPTKKIDYENGERFKVTDHEYVPGSPLPTLVKANVHNQSYSGTDNTEYRFIGNYIGEVSSSKVETNDEGTSTQSAEKAYVPQYSYMYAKKKNDTDYKFWFWYGATANGVVWNPNTCVVQATAKDGGSKEYTGIFGGSTAGAGNSAKQQSVFGADNETTAIENVIIIAGNDDATEVVYNLNGQVVSRDGNLNGLTKGVYIKGGKKFIVK